MLRDRFGRPFEKGQMIVFHDTSMYQGEVLEVVENPIASGNGQPPVQKLFVKVEINIPMTPGPLIVANVAIAKEAEPKSNLATLDDMGRH